MRVEAHIVVPEAGEAAEWYAKAFGAEEVSRIPLPSGRVMAVELRIGESAVHIATELPELGILSPTRVGGTATVLQIQAEDAEALWSRALGAGAEPSTCARSRPRRSSARRRRSSAARDCRPVSLLHKVKELH